MSDWKDIAQIVNSVLSILVIPVLLMLNSIRTDIAILRERLSGQGDRIEKLEKHE